MYRSINENDKVEPLLQYETSPQWHQKVQISTVSFEIGAKTFNYPNLEMGNKFWNRVWVSSSCYKSQNIALLLIPQIFSIGILK